MELRYLVTAWTADHGDERALLAGLMRSLLAHRDVPLQFVAEPLRAVGPLSLIMARSGEQHLDVVQALDGQLKPGISMVVVASVDTDVYTPAGPPVEVFETRLSFHGDGYGPAVEETRRVAGEIADAAAVGARVISPRGAAIVDPTGRFLVAARAGDEIVIQTDPPRVVTVPTTGGVRVT